MAFGNVFRAFRAILKPEGAFSQSLARPDPASRDAVWDKDDTLDGFPDLSLDFLDDFEGPGLEPADFDGLLDDLRLRSDFDGGRGERIASAVRQFSQFSLEPENEQVIKTVFNTNKAEVLPVLLDHASQFEVKAPLMAAGRAVLLCEEGGEYLWERLAKQAEMLAREAEQAGETREAEKERRDALHWRQRGAELGRPVVPVVPVRSKL